MVITLNVANELNTDRNWHGSDHYFLSQGRTLESCKKNLVKELKSRWHQFEYEADLTGAGDILDLLHTEFSRWHRTEQNWQEIFPDFCFPRNTHAEVWEISEEMAGMITDTIDQLKEGETA